MDAYVLEAAKRISRTAMPEPRLAPDQVAVAPATIGICGSDLAAYRGDHPRMHPPLVLGHEFAGTVAATGDEVRHFREGDQVAVDPVLTCEACEHCASGRRSVCADYKVIGCHPSVPGALGEVVGVSERQVWPLPGSCSLADGALVQPMAISYHATAVRGQVGSSERVLVLGAGPIGLGCFLIAHTLGALVAVGDIDQHRLAAAAELGAHATVDVADPSAIEALRATSNYLPDIVIDAAGGRQSSSLHLATDVVRPGGRVVVVGNFPAGIPAVEAAPLKSKELAVLGAQGYQRSSYSEVLGLLESGRLRAEQLISHRLPIADARAAFALLDDSSAHKIKIMLTRDTAP